MSRSTRILLLGALLAAVALVPAGCGRTAPLRYARDGGADAGVDGGVDGGLDGGRVPCIPGEVTLTRAVSQVMLVLDRSASMNAPFGTGTRWDSLTGALARVLPPIDRTVALGAYVFPLGSGLSCVAPPFASLSPEVGRVQAVVSLLTAISPGGHTPTADAVTLAGFELLSTHAATRARALVLATDGAPNCNRALDPRTCVCASGGICQEGISCLDQQRTVRSIAVVADAGVPTWVIGIQDSDAFAIDALEAMAIAGGHPRLDGGTAYYAVTSPAALEEALTEIRDRVGACVYLASSVPPQDRGLQLSLDGVPVPFDPTGEGGWRWVDRDNGELVVGGAACARALADPSSVLEGQVSCEPGDGG